jgi:tRNA(Ile)-lysidine synthase
MSDLLARVTQAIERHGLCAAGQTVVVGVSGGVDSLVLLHVLLALRDRLSIRLHVATLDHGLRGEAGAADAAFVRATAAAWGVPCTAGRADVPALADSLRLGIEETARRVRYTFLVQVARQVRAERVAVGHQRDDQAETVLLHLLRGSGLNGLRGMAPLSPLTGSHILADVPLLCDPPLTAPAAPDLWPVLIRPLLDISRAEIEAYAAAHGLQPRADASNADLTYLRNRLRHQVLPLLETLNPNIRQTLAQTADVLRADAEALEAAGAEALAQVTRPSPPGSVVFDQAAWAALPLAFKRYTLRAALRQLRPDLRDVTYAHIADAVTLAEAGRTGARAPLPGGLTLRVGYGALVIGPADDSAAEIGDDAPALDPALSGLSFTAGETVERTFGTWVFSARPLHPDDDLPALHADPLGAALWVPAGATLALRTRQAGDRFRPRGLGGHSQKLADTLIAMRVPAPWRERVPLLTVNGVIAWFVAPTPEGVRGRVAEPFARPDLPEDSRTAVGVMVCWRRLTALPRV